MEDFLVQINGVPQVTAEFVSRVAGVEVDTDRQATVARLEPSHREVVEGMGFSWEQCWRGEQIHGAKIGVIRNGSGEEASVIPGVDGLISNDLSVLLGIYVADCGAIYLADQVTGAIGLLHSGKKGTELGILTKALKMMGAEFGTQARDVIVALAPCIRPPAYEVDFAADIERQAMAAGIRQEHFIDSGCCTSLDLSKFYSYRSEKGSTGRMLALIGKS